MCTQMTPRKQLSKKNPLKFPPPMNERGALILLFTTVYICPDFEIGGRTVIILPVTMFHCIYERTNYVNH